MECLSLKYSRNEIKKSSTQRYKGPHPPYDAKSSAATHGAGSQVTSQSSGSLLGHMNVPQQSQYSDISAHN
jgi:hypothetical protein